MITDTFNFSVTGTDSTRLSGSDQEAATTQIGIDTIIPAASTNQALAISWTVANTQAVFIVANQNCTIKTNSTGSPGNTINLIAGIPLVWGASSGYYANPFTSNVTIFYVTCTPTTRFQAAVLTN